MPAAFLLADIEVLDARKYDIYRTQAVATVVAHGGEFLAGGGRFRRLEGDEPLPTIFVVKFESYEQALAWYYSEEYDRVKALRHGAAHANLVVVEGAS